MEILRTQISMSRVTEQYREATRLNLDVENAEKYEYILKPFNLVMNKVAGYMPEEDRTKAIGHECTAIFIDSDYIIIALGVKEFEAVLMKHFYNEK